MGFRLLYELGSIRQGSRLRSSVLSHRFDRGGCDLRGSCLSPKAGRIRGPKRDDMVPDGPGCVSGIPIQTLTLHRGAMIGFHRRRA